MRPDVKSSQPITQLSRDIENYLGAQICALFPGDDEHVATIMPNIGDAIRETQNVVCRLLEWKASGFNKLISWQYATFLYKLSRICTERGVSELATDRLFLLNKALHGLELHTNVLLPKNFFLSHTNAAVFSRADYSDFCVFHQGITVGRKGDKRPTLEEYLVMYPGSMIIGNCHVRKNTVLAPGVRLIDTDTPGDCYVFEEDGARVRFRGIDEIHAARFFDLNP